MSKIEGTLHEHDEGYAEWSAINTEQCKFPYDCGITESDHGEGSVIKHPFTLKAGGERPLNPSPFCAMCCRELGEGDGYWLCNEHNLPAPATPSALAKELEFLKVEVHIPDELTVPDGLHEFSKGVLYAVGKVEVALAASVAPVCDTSDGATPCKSNVELVPGYIQYLGPDGCEVHDEGLFMGFIPKSMVDAPTTDSDE